MIGKMQYLVGFIRMKFERRARRGGLWCVPDLLMQYLEDRYWAVRGLHVVECYGDSHIAAFRRVNFMFPNLKYRFRTTSVLSATAYGLGNRNSLTDARNIFERKLKRTKGEEIHLVCLGENDTSFLVWSRSQKRNLSLDEALDQSLSSYKEFLLYFRASVGRLMVCSSPLPTILDGQKNPSVALLRDSIVVPLAERTSMALRFNRAVREFCEEQGICFLDLDDEVIDHRTGLLDDRFFNTKRYDNHYVEVEYVKVMLPKFLALTKLLCE